MARKPRLVLDDGCYHVMQRGNDRRKVFGDYGDYGYFCDLLKRYLRTYRSFLYHYCLMPNHVHLLLRVAKAEELSKLMQGINLSYTLYYKGKYGFTGALWQGRFKSIIIDKDEYLMECGRYIERNPVRAGIVKNPGDYVFSSYNFYSSEQKSDIITTDILYKEISANKSERQLKYRDYVLRERAYDKIVGAVFDP